MIYVIISEDETTKFLYGIIEKLIKSNISLEIIEVQPNHKSYETALQKINNFTRNSFILFLGHGQSNQLYGGENAEFNKKALIKLNEMSIFKEQFLFLLSCDSNSLLKSCLKTSGIKKSIGFGSLPTEIKEVEHTKILSGIEISQNGIDCFKEKIVDIISTSIISYLQLGKNDFYSLKDCISLHINKSINAAVLEEENFELADLLFVMKNELVVF